MPEKLDSRYIWSVFGQKMMKVTFVNFTEELKGKRIFGWGILVKKIWMVLSIKGASLANIPKSIVDRVKHKRRIGMNSEREQARIVWNEAEKRFSTEEKDAYLEYRLLRKQKAGEVMEIVHTFVPPTKRGLGLASRLCVAAFSYAQSNQFSVIPTCSYVSDTFLPRNAAWNSILFKEDPRSQM